MSCGFFRERVAVRLDFSLRIKADFAVQKRRLPGESGTIGLGLTGNFWPDREILGKFVLLRLRFVFLFFAILSIVTTLPVDQN